MSANERNTMPKRLKKTLLGLAALAALALGAGALAQAGDSHGKSRKDQGGQERSDKGDRSEASHGKGAHKARVAALQYTSGGTANSVERDSENGATWEVEVTKTNGDTVDVRLDKQYRLVVIEGDSENQDESG
jgi:uncharacterized membrane protein YkoI